MKLDLRRRHAVMSTVTGLALAALVSCTTSTHTGSAHTGTAPSATIPPSALKVPLSGELAAGLARIRTTAKDNPPGDQWGHYRDEGGTVWYFWPLPDGRFCTGREFHLPGEEDLTQEVSCTTNPLPGDGTPALNALDGPASVAGGRWVGFLYADQEEVLDIACGDRHFTAERITRFSTPSDRRTVYAVSTPWAALGVLQAQVRRADGSTAPDRVRFVDGPGRPLASYERACT